MSKALPARRPLGLPNTCSDANLYAAVQAWLRGEPPKVVAELLNVPVKTIPHWVESREWNWLVNACRVDLQGRQNSQIGRYINLTLAELGERLENGDEFISKDGEVVRVKVKARDLAGIFGMLVEKKEFFERKLDGVPDRANTFEELMKMAESFRAANAKEIAGEATTVRDVPATPDTTNTPRLVAHVEGDVVTD